jgi:hypothetical protein
MQSQKQQKAKHKKLRAFSFTLLGITALCLSGYQLSTAKKLSNIKGDFYLANAAPAGVRQPPAQTEEVIDGEKNPEKIPDHVAYGMVFRVIAGREGENEKRSIRAYINQLGLGEQKCISCLKDDNKSLADPEIDVLIEAAESYARQVSLLDLQAKKIKDATWSNPTTEAKAELAKLQREKESLIKSIVASLHKQLGPDATGRLRQQVNQRVKSRIKIKKAAS